MLTDAGGCWRCTHKFASEVAMLCCQTLRLKSGAQKPIAMQLFWKIPVQNIQGSQSVHSTLNSAYAVTPCCLVCRTLVSSTVTTPSKTPVHLP